MDAVELQIATAPPVWAVGNQIQQILLNLLVNARQAMPNGGQLLIRVEHDQAANMVDLTVRDSGSGIPADKLRQIFEPFFTTKTGPDETGKGGTRLGLPGPDELSLWDVRMLHGVHPDGVHQPEWRGCPIRLRSHRILRLRRLPRPSHRVEGPMGGSRSSRHR